MAEVVTFVTGHIQTDRVGEIVSPYREALKNGPPPDLEETFLLTGDADRWLS